MKAQTKTSTSGSTRTGTTAKSATGR
jgi:hypothetical protein